MSYYTELTNHPSDSHVREACAEVDRLRAELSAEHERAEFFRAACISMEAERDEIGAELDAREAECKRLAGLVREVLAQHADPESPWFNDCSEGKLCLWCENAKAALSQTAANDAARDGKGTA